MGALRKFMIGTVAACAMVVIGHNAQALEVNESASYKASAEEVWHVVNEFGGLNKWHPWFTSTTLHRVDGALHRLVVAGNPR